MTSLRVSVAGVALVVALCAAGGGLVGATGAARSRLAVPADQGAAAFAGGGVVGPAARSATGRLAGEAAGGRSGSRDGAAARADRAGTGKIRAFAEQAGDQKQPKLLELLAGLFSVLDDERSAVIDGLDRFGARQKELAAALRERQRKAARDAGRSGSDAGDVNQMMQRVTWEAQVFQDRRQSLSYACDVPGKIEQRLFALARTIQQALQ